MSIKKFSIKDAIKNILDIWLGLTVRNRQMRTFYKYLGYYSMYYDEKQICKLLSPEQKVLNGPFKGLQYHKLESSGSSLIAKIIGSYEDELSKTLEEFFRNDYETIIDIGCAEGYYAVGLALKFPRAKVYAYDTNPKAREKCKKMAMQNGVSDHVIISGLCTAETLENFKFKRRALIVCDCEGYESELFTERSVTNLVNCDLIIELHDSVQPNISNAIIAVFSQTHDVTLVNSTYDKRLKEYVSSLPQKFDLFDRTLSERGNLMSWAVVEVKKETEFVDT